MMSWSRVTLWCSLFFTHVSLYGLSSVGAELPDNITFQVYVAFDNVLHNQFETPYEAQKYAVVFFNAVNLIFREMTKPRIQFEVVMFHQQMVPFTYYALALEGDEVNATASLPKAAAYTSRLPQFNSSDIIFIMSGRKVFSKGNVNKDYYPPGLTAAGEICNRNRRVVIVSDIGKRFEALPNAGFQLGRLLGAPTNCTKEYYRLFGNLWLFKLTDCHMNAIRDNLKKLVKKDPVGTRQCFVKRYTRSLSSYIKDLPSSLVSPQQICKEHKGEKWGEPYDKNLCMVNVRLNKPPDSLARTIINYQKGGCFFRCCYTSHYIVRADAEMATYFSFDGSPCNGVQKPGICAVGQCITNYKP